MYDPHLRVTVTGPTWQMQNPLRTSNDDPAVRVRDALDAHDRAAARATAVGLAAGLVFAITIAVVSGAVGPSAILGVIVGASVGWWWHRRAVRSYDQLEERNAELTGTLGPHVWFRASVASEAVAEQADTAMRSAMSITQSRVFAHGSLGAPDAVAADVRDALWEVLQLASDADRRARLHGTTTATIDTLNADDEVSEHLVSAAEQTLADDLHQLRSYNEALSTVARQVDTLSARSAAPAIERRLIEAASPMQRDTDMSALGRLAAQVSAAQTVLDSSGSRPDSIDGPF